MSPSALVLYLDRGAKRLAHRFDEMVLATRIANADQKTYNRWHRSRQQRTGQGGGVTGAALERAVLGLRARNPEYVVIEAA